MPENRQGQFPSGLPQNPLLTNPNRDSAPAEVQIQRGPIHVPIPTELIHIPIARGPIHVPIPRYYGMPRYSMGQMGVGSRMGALVHLPSRTAHGNSYSPNRPLLEGQPVRYMVDTSGMSPQSMALTSSAGGNPGMNRIGSPMESNMDTTEDIGDIGCSNAASLVRPARGAAMRGSFEASPPMPERLMDAIPTNYVRPEPTSRDPAVDAQVNPAFPRSQSNTGFPSSTSNHPNPGFPNSQTNTSVPSSQSNTGYPSTQSNTASTSNLPTPGYPNSQSNAGVPNSPSTTSFPSSQSNTGFSNIQSNTGYTSSQSNTCFPSNRVPSSDLFTGSLNSQSNASFPSSESNSGIQCRYSNTSIPSSQLNNSFPSSDSNIQYNSSETITVMATSQSNTNFPSNQSNTGFPSNDTNTGFPNSQSNTRLDSSECITGVSSSQLNTGFLSLQYFPGVSQVTPVLNQEQQPIREHNTASLCRFGQETVQDIVSRTHEIFQILKVIRPPNGTVLGDKNSVDKKAKVEEQLRTVNLLFRRLRIIFGKCNASCLPGKNFNHVADLIPYEDDEEPVTVVEEKETSETYKLVCQENKELIDLIMVKNLHLKEVIDKLRNIIWMTNVMLAMHK